MTPLEAQRLYEIAQHYPYVVILPNGEMYGVESKADGETLIEYELQALHERMVEHG